MKKLIVIFICCFLIISCSGPWDDLAESYEVPKKPANNNLLLTKSVVLSGTNYQSVHSYKGIVIESFNNEGIYLELKRPYSWLHKPIFIPTSIISACSRTQWSSGWDTNVWISEKKIELAFPDNNKSILNWCLKNNIEYVNRDTVRKWLYEP